MQNKTSPTNTFCISPWTEVHVDQEGRIGFCCVHKGFVGHIKDVKFSDTFNGPDYKLARQQTLNNIWPSGCQLCEKSEQYADSSMRYNNWIQYKSDLNNNVDFTNLEQQIKKFKVDFSNACNLRCTMCSPHRSTGWYKDIKVIEDNLTQEEVSQVVFNPKNREYGLPISFIDDNLDVILKTELIDVSGGEPFYMPQFKYLVDKLIEHNYKGKLKIITNLTLVDKAYFEKIKTLNSTLVVSMDGVNNLYEYIRPSIPFGKYKGTDIQDRIKDYNQHLTVSIAYTPQLMNVYNISDYITWLETFVPKQDIGFNFNSPLTGPKYLSISVHPDIEYKNKLADEIEQKFGKESRLNMIVDHLRTPRTKQDEDDWKLFCKTIDILDKHRKTSIIKYIPELEKYWIKE